MTLHDIAAERLTNQHLVGELARADDIVRLLGAVQAQDFTGAKWAIGQRTKHATDADVTKLFNDGKILRTHMLRPTWHFVAPEDIRWMQALTAPRVHQLNKYYYKKFGLDEATLRKSTEVLTKSLKGGKQLTREEIQEGYRAAGIDSSGLKLTYLIMYAELEALVCSGALKDKQHTYALLDERVPKTKPLSPDQALAELTKRYFASHGPAQVKDFGWWASLPLADVKKGIQLAKLKNIEINGKEFFYAGTLGAKLPSPVVSLLPNYDELVIAYKDQTAAASDNLDKHPSYEDLSYHFVASDGQIIAGWKRDSKPKTFIVKLNRFRKMDAAETKAFEVAIKKLQDFVQLPVALEG